MSSREEIIRDVARTLFVMAWADGVERGEIAGEGPGAGGDWMDAAPAPQCRPCRGHGSTWNGHGEAHECGSCAGSGKESDLAAEAEARRIVDGFDAACRGYGGAFVDLNNVPVEHAARTWAELSNPRRSPLGPLSAERAAFAHCLAMQALGSGVGLEDDMPAGVRLPGWIRASVPRSDFGAHDLDPERYPAPPEPTPRGVVRDPDGLLPSFAWPGGYAIRYAMADGAELCAACANGENDSRASCRPSEDEQWRIVAGYVVWEGPAEHCAHCGEPMETEYGDPDMPAPEAAP